MGAAVITSILTLLVVGLLVYFKKIDISFLNQRAAPAAAPTPTAEEPMQIPAPKTEEVPLLQRSDTKVLY